MPWKREHGKHFTSRLISIALIVSFLFGKVQALEKDVDLYATALAAYKADELFDQLADNGDPFPLLAALEPDEVLLFLLCYSQ